MTFSVPGQQVQSAKTINSRDTVTRSLGAKSVFVLVANLVYYVAWVGLVYDNPSLSLCIPSYNQGWECHILAFSSSDLTSGLAPLRDHELYFGASSCECDIVLQSHLHFIEISVTIIANTEQACLL